MQFDWTTFALEALNFLVLVWLLQHFLYRPVLGAIDRRRAAIEKGLADARAAGAQAEALKRDYESRLADWAREKQAALARLDEELDAERARRFSALQQALEQEREKNRVLDERRARDASRAAEDQARAEGGAFVAALLARLATPTLERSILAAMLEDLARLAEAKSRELQAAAAAAGYRAAVTSRYPLAEPDRRALVEAVTRAAGHAVECEFQEDAALLAGLRIAIGACLLQASLRDELEFFAAEASHQHG